MSRWVIFFSSVALMACSSPGGRSTGSGSDDGGSGDGFSTATGGDAGVGDTGAGAGDTGAGAGDTGAGAGDTGAGTGADTGAATGDDGECVPFCQPGWECGPDGCDGECGDGCGAGEICNNSQHVCVGDQVGKPFGEPCGRQDQCQPQLDTPTGTIDNPQWPACVNAQCETGLCTEPVCSKNCTITKDQTDWQGNPGPDGIDDPDAAFNDCSGAEDGIMGDQFTCVSLLPPDGGQPLNWCIAGTTFEECATNADCPAGEACTLQYIVGEYSARCATAAKGSVGVAEYCNRNPDTGDLAYCDTGLCFGIGCTGFCAQNSDCYPAGCSSDDCTPFECKKNFELFGADTPDIVFDLCFSKVCETNAGCPSGAYCTISGNGKSGAEADYEHLCAVAAPNAAALGEKCENDPSDNVPLPECAGPCLNNGTCSALCNTDADCAAGGSMKCNANAVGIDFQATAENPDGDGVDDKHLALGLCVDYPGSNDTCGSDADCGDGEVCDFLPFFANADQTEIDGKGICVTFEAGEGDIGDACGGNSGVDCKSGFCLGSQGDQPGYCTALCASKADCPNGQSLGLFPGTYNLACRALLYSDGFIEGSEEDYMYIPLCIPTVADTSPLTDCSADKTCGGANEACQPFPIAIGATGPTSLDFLCVGAGTFDDQGTFQAATGGMGASCDLTFESTSGSDYCTSNQCLEDDNGSGYCSGLCDSDADCSGGLTCQAFTLIDRVGSADDLTVDLCQK